ncbi:hypothetical protein ACWEWX_32195, partial [Streptomyces asiaticus]
HGTGSPGSPSGLKAGAVTSSSVDLSWSPVTGAAVRLLLERLEHPGRPPRTVRLPCAFVHRTSCGCVAEALDRPPLPGTPGLAGKDPVS